MHLCHALMWLNAEPMAPGVQFVFALVVTHRDRLLMLFVRRRLCLLLHQPPNPAASVR